MYGLRDYYGLDVKVKTLIDFTWCWVLYHRVVTKYVSGIKDENDDKGGIWDQSPGITDHKSWAGLESAVS